MPLDRVTRRTWLAGAVSIAAEAGMAAPAEHREPLSWTLTEAAATLARRTISSEELTKLCLARIGKLDRHLNAFITVDSDSALARARECDRRRPPGRKLHGVPIA